jgi:hypothetical protein
VRGGGAQDLVFCACALEREFEALVIGLQAVGRRFEGRELGFEVADVAFFAFAEGALAAPASAGLSPGFFSHEGYRGYGEEWRGGRGRVAGMHSRSPILRLSPTLRHRQPGLLLLTTAPCPAIPRLHIGPDSSIQIPHRHRGLAY